jgi:hypothetical protein
MGVDLPSRGLELATIDKYGAVRHIDRPDQAAAEGSKPLGRQMTFRRLPPGGITGA